MKLIFKQKVWSLVGKYEIYNEKGDVEYTVQGKFGIPAKFYIYDKNGNEISMVKQKILSLFPTSYICINDEIVGTIKRKFSFFKPKYDIDYKDWEIDGNFFEWDYTVYGNNRSETVAVVKKELFKFTDTYTLNILKEDEAPFLIAFIIAIDVEKARRN